jgi:putative membrane protein insertion efficiency factor
MRKHKLKLAVFALVLFATTAVAVDVSRQPENQLTGRSYVAMVRVYQVIGRPLLKGVVACRFRPTCSDYSIEAVRRHGTIRGLVLTVKRIKSCQNSVPMGTSDPVPN